MLVNGHWSANWDPVQGTDEHGRFVRRSAGFRDWVGATPAGVQGRSLPAEAGRYHLYVALICPWACRTLMARAVKGLNAAVSVSVVEPWLSGTEGWAFGTGIDTAQDDPWGTRAHVHELYTESDPSYTGRATVPVLWDRQESRIVSNESADIVRMFDTGFGDLADDAVRLRPDALADEIDALNDTLYTGLNNGVYQAGFAATQGAYDEAVSGVFATLDALEERLSDGRRWLFGDALTETDLRLFVSLVRFDAAYHGLFKCNLRLLSDYAALSSFVERMLQVPGVASTVNLNHIREGYYSIRAVNPLGIVPAGPSLAFSVPTHAPLDTVGTAMP